MHKKLLTHIFISFNFLLGMNASTHVMACSLAGNDVFLEKEGQWNPDFVTEYSISIEYFLICSRYPKILENDKGYKAEFSKALLEDCLGVFKTGHVFKKPHIIHIMENLLTSFLSLNPGSMNIWPYIAQFYIQQGYDTRLMLRFFESRPDILASDKLIILFDLINCPGQPELHTSYLLGLIHKNELQSHEIYQAICLLDYSQLTASDWLSIIDNIFLEPDGFEEIRKMPKNILTSTVDFLKTFYECFRLKNLEREGFIPMKKIEDARRDYEKYNALLKYSTARKNMRRALTQSGLKLNVMMAILEHLNLFPNESPLQNFFLRQCAGYIHRTDTTLSMDQIGTLTHQAHSMGHLSITTRLTNRVHRMINSPSLKYSRPIISFVASAEPSGDGVNPDTFDYFMGNQYLGMSLFVPELESRGCLYQVLNWENHKTNWDNLECLFVGPVWGYSKKQVAFNEWLTLMESLNIPLINSMEFILWNFKKTYLQDLQEAGISVIPTMIIPENSDLTVAQILTEAKEKFETTDIVVKGVVGAGGFDYMHYKPGNETDLQAHLDTLKANNCGAVIQPFWKQVSQKGELSFVFIGNALSHSYLKVCAPDSELVQVFYGGQSFHITKEDLSLNSSAFIAKLQKFRPDLKITEEDLVVAHGQIHALFYTLKQFFIERNISTPPIVRLDCVIRDSQLYLMEVEGIDPYLEIDEATRHDPMKKVVKWMVDEILRQRSIHRVQKK